VATKTRYELTPEAEAQLGPWHERWLKIATNTDPITEDDRDVMRSAVEGLYRAANLTPPPRDRIVFVPSPLVAVLAGGFAAAIWYMRENPNFEKEICGSVGAADLSTGDATRAATWDATRDATRDATGDATRDATWDATRDATWDATRDATGDATWDATRDATGDATGDATRAATWDATWDATRDATWAATRAATWDATRDATGAGSRLSPLAKWMLECAYSAHSMLADGGEFTGYVEWIEFLREACGYERDGRVDYTNWQPWRDTTLHGGMRIMHPKFCIVSDRPCELHIETANGRGRLHSDRGPAKSYGDHWAIYAIHGIRVTQQIVDAPGTLTPEQILTEGNAEIRRIMVDRFGAERLLREAQAKLLDEDAAHGKLYRLEVAGDEPIVMLEVVNSSPEPIGYDPASQVGTWRANRWFKHYMLRVPPTMKTARAARAWTFNLPAAKFAPLVET
jgi:hypothetical protein